MRNTLSFLKALGAAVLVAAPAVLAQSLPVGVSGYWKITKMYPKKSVATPTCAANPAFFNKNAKGSRVLLSDRITSADPVRQNLRPSPSVPR